MVLPNKPVLLTGAARPQQTGRAFGGRDIRSYGNQLAFCRACSAALVGVASGAGPGTLTWMVSHISAAEAVQTFPEMIERVRADGAVFVVEQGGEPICQIAPVGRAQRTVRDLVRLLQSAPRPDDAYLDAVEEVANNQPTLPEVPWES